MQLTPEQKRAAVISALSTERQTTFEIARKAGVAIAATESILRSLFTLAKVARNKEDDLRVLYYLPEAK